MDDLISRQDAIDAIEALSDTIFKNIEKGATYPPRAWFAGMANAESIIKDLPSIDAVPVIRCKDCKHYKQSDVADRKMCCRKDVDGKPACYDFLPDDWCKYGERKEE